MINKLSRYIKYRLWAAQQFPDPEYLYGHGGVGDVVRYLKSCASGENTRAILARFGANIHPEAKPVGPWITLQEVAKIDDFAKLTIGRSAHVGKEVFLDLCDEITIEESATIGMRSMILTHVNLGEGYPNKPTTRMVRTRRAPTIFKRGCSVGAGAIILHGVTVGEDAVVGAGVVVKKDVPSRTIIRSSAQLPDYVMPDRFFESSEGNAGTGASDSGETAS